MTSDDAGDANGSQTRVVRLKLRYKSATVDEFIEKYALDVSPRGIYVNIAKPLALGTLVKLEIRLASEQVVIKGAGTVVWTRKREHASGTRPSGLWIKFLQIDDPSKAFIETLASARADAGMAYEEHAEKEDWDAPVAASPAQSHQAAEPLPVAAAPRLRATLVGITAPATLPARPRLSSLPPLPTPPPPKAAPLPVAPVTLPPRPRLASLPPLPLPPPPVTAPAVLLAAPRPASLPPIPTPPPPKARSAPPVPALAYEEPSEKDAEDETVIWDHEPSRREASVSPVPVASAPPAVATAQQRSAHEASMKTIVTRRRSPSPYELPRWARSGAWVALGFFATVGLALGVRSTRWFRSLTTAETAPVSAGVAATSAAAATTSAETAMVLARPAEEAPPDAAAAETPPADVLGAPMSTSPQAIITPTPAPSPKAAPAPRATNPVPMGFSTVRAKPKPKPAATIDDGF
jgi:uncharacterized protein (TIGR02266 family)